MTHTTTPKPNKSEKSFAGGDLGTR
jgi:hypothetical protein